MIVFLRLVVVERRDTFHVVPLLELLRELPQHLVGIKLRVFLWQSNGDDSTPVEQPVLPEAVEDVVTVTDETSGALTPEGNLTLVDDYHTDYSDGSGQQFITLVSKSGATFYLVIDRNAKGQQTVHFMNLVDESDLLALMEEEDADAYTCLLYTSPSPRDA